MPLELLKRLQGQSYREEAGGDGGDGGGGGDGGDGDEGGKGGDGGGDERLAALEKGLQLVAGAVSQQGEAMGKLVERLENIGQGGGGKGSSGGGDDDDGGVDLETMDRKTFAAYMTGQTRKAIEDVLKPLTENVGKLDEKIDAHGLSIMIKDFQKDHPDFFEWRSEMQALLKDTPTLSPARAYALARVEDPSKAKKLDEKYGLSKPANRNADQVFAGLFPSSSGGSTTAKAGKMTAKEAASAAWDEVMSQVGTQH